MNHIKRAVMIAVAAIGISGATAATSPEIDPAEYALEYACEVRQVDCSELEAPRIEYGHFRQFIGAYGYYWHQLTPDTVFMDVGFREAIEAGDFRSSPVGWSVLVHEVTHYVDRSLDATIPACETEANGWHVGNLWLLEQGYWELAVWDWWDRYPRCDRPQVQ